MLGHKFISLNVNNRAWHVCTICDVKVYIFQDGEMYYWSDDLFHDNLHTPFNRSSIKFNLTCEEIIIKKIIE